MGVEHTSHVPCLSGKSGTRVGTLKLSPRAGVRVPNLLLGGQVAERTMRRLGLLPSWAKGSGGGGEMLSKVRCWLNGWLPSPRPLPSKPPSPNMRWFNLQSPSSGPSPQLSHSLQLHNFPGCGGLCQEGRGEGRSLRVPVHFRNGRELASGSGEDGVPGDLGSSLAWPLAP